MKCVVPLAGPDLVHRRHGFRPLVPHNGIPLLRRALDHRPWRGRLEGSDFIFVTRSVPGIEALESWLAETWIGCQIVRLSQLTGGALYSALAGAAAVSDADSALIIDLADILFSDGPDDPSQLFDAGVGAVVPCFRSDDPSFSYLRCEDACVVEAAEKRVISNNASAGVYIFRDCATYLVAAAHSIRNRDHMAFNGALFVCPAVNGVLAQGLSVLMPLLDHVEPVGKMFHGTVE